MKRYTRVTALLLSLLTATTLCACKQESTERLKREDWAPDVKSAINDLMERCGGQDAYAVFDFDNTTAIFDVEEQLAIYQLQVMAFAVEPEQLPQVLTAGLSDLDADRSSLGYCKGSYRDLVADICEAYGVLWQSYGGFTPAGVDEQTQKCLAADPYWQEFAAKMRMMYDLIYDAESSQVAYPWLLYWFTGMTEEEVYHLAYASHTAYGARETEIVTWESSLPSRTGQVQYSWTAGVSVTENMRELWRALQENGIDVWVCSASCTAAIRAAIDAFGLHDYCTGMLAMTVKTDENGRYIPEYDSAGCGYYCRENGTWTKMSRPEGTQTQGEGKVTAIVQAIAPDYHGRGPVAGFMDSGGDFPFCTEFSSLQLVVCFNRANRKVTDGGGLVAELAVYQRDTLGYDLAAAQAAGDTLYVLQGRDENGGRSFRSSNATVRYGEDEERLFANEENRRMLQAMADQQMSTKEILERFSVKTAAEDSDFGFRYGFLESACGYHVIP